MNENNNNTKESCNRENDNKDEETPIISFNTNDCNTNNICHVPIALPIKNDCIAENDIFCSIQPSSSGNHKFIGKVKHSYRFQFDNNNGCGYSNKRLRDKNMLVSPINPKKKQRKFSIVKINDIQAKATPFIFKHNSKSILMVELLKPESTQYQRMKNNLNQCTDDLIKLVQVNSIDLKPIDTIIHCKICNNNNGHQLLKKKFIKLQYGFVMIHFAVRHGGILSNNKIQIYKKNALPYLRITKIRPLPSVVKRIVLSIKCHYVKQGKINIHLVSHLLRYNKKKRIKEIQGILCQSYSHIYCGINGYSGISSILILINPSKNKYRLMDSIRMVQGDQFADLKCITKSYASGYCVSNTKPLIQEIYSYHGISEIIYEDKKSILTQFSNFDCFMKVIIYYIHSANSVKYKAICKKFGGKHINSKSFNEIQRKCQEIVFGENCDSSDGKDSIYIEIKGRNEYTSTKCYKCGNKYTLKECKCKRCRVVRYCSKRCQKLDWRQHRCICSTFQLRKYDINDRERFHRGI